MPPAAGTFRFFRATVAAITDLTPSFRRFTFASDDLSEFGDPGFDQRIKIVFPLEGSGLDAMPTGEQWWPQWRAMPEDTRPSFRTYTTRFVRTAAHEVDVDMVVHDVLGPASAWIVGAQIGDEVLLYGPNRTTGANLGIDFVPPAHTDHILLAGDETAAPALAVILEQLPASAHGTVVLEVPLDADIPYLPDHPGFEARVASREHGTRDDHLVAGASEVAGRLVPDGRGSEVEEIDIDHNILWEVPRTAKGGAALKSAPLYAWLAGEAGAITRLRRHLVSELGVDRRAVAFMGYWRLGRAEN